MTSRGCSTLARQTTFPINSWEGHWPVSSAIENISQKFDRTVLGILFRSLMETPSRPHADESCLETTSWPNSSGVMLGQRSWRRGKNLRAKSRMTFHRSKGTSRCRSHRAFQAWANAASRSSFVPVQWSWVTTSARDTASMSCNHRQSSSAWITGKANPWQTMGLVSSHGCGWDRTTAWSSLRISTTVALKGLNK